MSFAEIEKALTIHGFSASDEARIKASLQTGYSSPTAKTMFDSWVAAGNLLNIYDTDENNAFAIPSSGNVWVNLDWLSGNSYITPNGKAVEDQLVTLLLHEFVHAVEGLDDTLDPASGDYAGDTVTRANIMFVELGLSPQLSYSGYDDRGLHQLNYEYTNGAAIDVAITSTGNISVGGSNPSLSTKDLLIGGMSGNTLISGPGNDFLVGQGGNDVLKGGSGIDTAVYLGDKLEYDVRQNSDGAWTVEHLRGGRVDGKDRLENIEKIQFDGGEVFDLKPRGLTYQTDFAFVIDTTGSMGSSIASVKTKALSIVDTIFGGGTIDARMGIVGFKDETIGEETSVILPFTDHVSFADRKSAITDAINSITVFGGGDLPETPFSGLLHALDGSMGEWRPGAGALRVVLFTDAEAKDGSLQSVVQSYASNIGVTITSGRHEAYASGSISSFDFETTTTSGREDVTLEFFDVSDPIDPVKPSTLEIYTINTGSSFIDFGELEAVATATGGDTFSSLEDDEFISKIIEIIEKPSGSLFEIFRFFNTENGAHFFTSSIDERDAILAELPNMTYEGNAFDSNTNATTGVAIHRFYNTEKGFHFYTASELEKETVEETLPQYAYEGVAYYASDDDSRGGEELYRFFNTQLGNHFYTTSEEERDNIIASLPHYSYEGIAYYVDVA